MVEGKFPEGAEDLELLDFTSVLVEGEVVAHLLLEEELLEEGEVRGLVELCPAVLPVLLDEVLLELAQEGAEGEVLAPVNVSVVAGDAVLLVVLPGDAVDNRGSGYDISTPADPGPCNPESLNGKGHVADVRCAGFFKGGSEGCGKFGVGGGDGEVPPIAALHIKGGVYVGEAEVFVTFFIVEILVGGPFKEAVHEALELWIVFQVVSAVFEAFKREFYSWHYGHILLDEL